MYQVGQICIGQKMVNDITRNRMECEIIASAKQLIGEDRITGEKCEGYYYTVQWADGIVSGVNPINLRPKHEPGSWDELEKTIGWRPGVMT